MSELTSLERIVYVSRAATGVGPAQTYDIIRTAHNRNSRFGLTGALLLMDGYFVQVLEGDGFHVQDRIARISTDPRHTDVDVRQHIGIRYVSFPGEWMALRSGDEVGPELREQFAYEPGFPLELFDGDRLLQFMVACWQRARRAAA